ncbi:MAG: antibiotic biosynthesis monooxygenase [Lentisphaerae bacterium]|nr:antibiotic biosynthesis monooxygenase [Lentisphaerota bacterium]
MIRVIASIRVKDGKLAEFLERFKANLPHVRAEQGCIEYVPVVDIDMALPSQELDPQTVTVIEQWESEAALRAHLVAPHMDHYREAVKDLVEKVALTVLKDVDG